ncbi:hypothetical protein BLNAU_9125 [Blattamonas nauphoetae]|uniref:Protein kinase domain-containing protein n=1 Tax=Blattamonas nauphoetae TaxID=2049346 RepID=A0ABQ9XWV2_9EUKA|nr:hypothetical protein BLNAU_9125 [Blattamonas nauphoetae]
MDSWLKDGNPDEAIFTVFNSSLRFERLSVSVSHAGSVCFLADSDLELTSCSILSSAECPPFVVSTCFGSRQSTVQILSSSHESSDSNLLSPLVGFGKIDSDLVSQTIWKDSPKSEYPCSISVVGHSVSFSSTSLVGRSGPLLEMDQKLQNEFASADCQPSEDICSTALISSSFVNVSSLSLGSRSRTNQPQLTQKVIGCSVLRSTDHFSGTAIRSMNMGGNVLCSNSSFAHCSSVSDEDITQGDRIVLNRTAATTETFTYCTFRHMTCSSTEHVGGAAIALDYQLAFVTIALCAFHDCNATDNSADGGAVCFWGTGQDADPASTIAISQTSFTTSSTADCGGALCVYFIESLSVDDCSFGKNSANSGGGAFACQSMIWSTFSNTSFVDNRATVGGVMLLNSAIQLSFVDLLFRDNVATRASGGSDISFAKRVLSDLSEENLTRCDSSSAIPTIFFDPDKSTDSTLLSRVSQSFGILSCSVSHSGTTSTVTISTVNAVSGVMSVLLSGGLVPRLVFVSFGSGGSTTGTGTTTTAVLPSSKTYSVEAAVLAGFKQESSVFGVGTSLTTTNTTTIDLEGLKLVSGSYSMLVKDASGTQTNVSLTVSSSTKLSTTVSLYPISSAKLKFETKYTVTSVLRGATSVFVRNDLSFTTPTEPARIVGIWGKLDVSGNTTSITVRGRQIARGSYTVRLNSENGPSFPISFSGEMSDERNSSASSVSIFGDSPVLSFGVTFTLFSVTPTSSPSTSLLVDANPNTFLISEPARITGTKIGSLSDALKTEATLTMTGRLLKPNTDYTISLSGHTKSPSSMGANADADKRTITIKTDSSDPSESGSKTIKFYPQDSAELMLGYEYSVDSVYLDGLTLLQNSGLSFSTPSEPARLSLMKSCSLTEPKDGVIVIVEGFALKEDTTLMIVTSSDGDEIESDGKIEVKTSSECWIRFKASWAENTTHLEFLKTYTLTTVREGSTELIITPELNFTVPSGPIVTSISAPLTCNSSSFSVDLVGTDLPIESGFRVELDGGLWFLVDFDSSTTGNGTISASLPGQFQFDTSYSVASVTKGDRKMKCESVSFKTPVGPTLVDGKAALSASDVNNVIVSLESLRMPVGEMTLTVQEGSSTPILMEVSFVSSEAGSVEVVVFGGSTLKYGTSYSVVSLTSSSLQCSLDKPIAFSTPAAPARIKTASCSLVGELQRSGEVVVSGEALPAGTSFSISLDEIDESGDVIASTTPISLSDRFGGEIGDAGLTTHTLTIALFPIPQLMKYSGRYRITSLSISSAPTAVEQTATFNVPAEPSRLLSLSPLLSASLETVTLTLGGRCFDVGDFTVKLQVTSPSSGTPFEVACSAVSETELEVTLPISSSEASSVEFGDVLSVLSLKNESSSAILEMSTFSIPHPPRVDNASFSFCSDLNTTFSVTLRGTDLPSNEQFLVVLDSHDSFEMEFSKDGSGTSVEMALGWEDTLEYDTEYGIVSITNEDTGRVVFVGSSLSFTTGKRPKKIVVFFDSSSLDCSRLCGSEDSPCSSMDSAWMIASNVGALDISLRLILNSTLSSRIVCLQNGIVVVEKGTSTEPTLTIPSSALMGENGMISISSGLFEFRDVDVVIESIDRSFVLLSALDSTIVLRDGSIVGVKTRNSLNSDELSCEWETGIVQLSNCTTNVTETILSHISQGVVNMRGGNLTIFSSSFSSNSPYFSMFPSFRQNIRCSENGKIEIGSLHGGDGTVDFPSAWISTTDCKVGGAAVRQASSHFIPTLSSKSTSSFNKKDKTFTLEMTGTTLIPCDMFLEVFEVDKQKKEGKAERMKLDLDTTTSFTESSISLTFSQSSLSSLDSSLEWRGRVIFGSNETRSSWFVVQLSSQARMAQSIVDNMKWWIPVVVCAVCLLVVVIIVLVCCRRRMNKPTKESLASQKELSVIDEEKIEIKEDDDVPSTNELINRQKQTYTGLKEFDRQADSIGAGHQNVTVPIGSGVEMIPVIRVNGEKEQVEEGLGNKMDTLFDRLHNPLHKPLRNRRRVAWEIGNGLMKIASENRNAPILGFVSPHQILFDKDDGILFKEKFPTDVTTLGSMPTAHPASSAPHPPADGSGKDEHVMMNEMDAELMTLDGSPESETNHAEQSLIMSEETEPSIHVSSFDGIRWMAPELVNRDGTLKVDGVDLTKAAVFSLGLVLFSIETGQVPFGEIDGLSAHRQLSSGLLPLMELVSSEEMDEMITRCVSPVAKNRPSLSEVVSFLAQEASKNPSLTQIGNGFAADPL